MMHINTTPLERGVIDGRKWLRGNVPVGKDNWVFIDTIQDKGIAEICKLLSRFVTYQALKVRFSSFSTEDTMQEIYALIVEAIPSYELGKNSNMLTFLQNHVKNRIINMCKYFSESRRRAIHSDVTIVKARCPQCKNVIRTEKAKSYTCPKCQHIGNKDWKVYNTPVLPIPFSAIRLPSNNRNTQERDILDSIAESDGICSILGEETTNIEKLVEIRLDFAKLYGMLDEMDRKMLDMFLAGNGHKDVAKALGLSEKATYVRVGKIIGKFKKMQG